MGTTGAGVRPPATPQPTEGVARRVLAQVEDRIGDAAAAAVSDRMVLKTDLVRGANNVVLGWPSDALPRLDDAARFHDNVFIGPAAGRTLTGGAARSLIVGDYTPTNPATDVVALGSAGAGVRGSAVR